MDYILPLDSSMFEKDFRTPVDQMLKLDRIKRITVIQTDKISNTFRLVLEDRDPLYTKEVSPCRIFTLGYYKDWLLSLNNQKAQEFKDCLEKFQKEQQLNSFDIAAISLDFFKMIDPKASSVIEQNSEKIWITQLNDKTQYWIKNQKFCAKIYETDLITGAIKMVYFDMSRNLLEQLNFHPTLSSKLKGFEIFGIIKSLNWIELWTKRFESDITNWSKMRKYIDNQDIEMPYQVDFNTCKFLGDHKVFKNTGHLIYKERYIHNSRLYTKTTWVFI